MFVPIGLLDEQDGKNYALYLLEQVVSGDSWKYLPTPTTSNSQDRYSLFRNSGS